MAVQYGSNNNKVIIYYVVLGLVIIAAGIFIFYPRHKNKVAEPNTVSQTQAPVQSPVQQPTQQLGQTQQPTQSKPVTPPANSTNTQAAALIATAQQNINDGKILQARNTLNDVLNMSLDPSTRELVKKQMTDLADQWLFTRVIQLGDELCSTYKVMPGDNLTKIASRHHVPYQLLMKVNNMQTENALRVGQVIKIVEGPFHAVAYKSSYTLDIYLQNVYVRSYKIGIGKEGHSSPVGLWKVKSGGKMIKPTWTDPATGRTYHADDPDYPLGSGWIALEGTDTRTRGIQGIAIHGTKDETTIGTKSSLGCLRLYNGELMEVYNMMEPGFSEVRICE